LLQTGLLSLIGLFRKLWLVHLKIQPLQALDASDELRFRNANWGWCWHAGLIVTHLTARRACLRRRLGLAI
jgi:hypothetical protein